MLEENKRQQINKNENEESARFNKNENNDRYSTLFLLFIQTKSKRLLSLNKKPKFLIHLVSIIKKIVC